MDHLPYPFNRLRKKLVLPMFAGIAVVGFLMYFVFSLSPEPMTPQEILEKKEWKPAELSRSIGHVFSPQTSRRERDKVLEHLRTQLKKYPEDQQRKIRVDALRIAVNNGLAQMRALPPERRKQMIDKMQKDADRNYQAVLTRNGIDRQKLQKMKQSEEYQMFNQEVASVTLSELSTKERREYNGLIKSWVKIMQLP
jgi:endo-1,4-beta-D-glucanase Y